MFFRRRSGMLPPAREVVAELLQAPTFELIPLKDAMDHTAFLPSGARVSVTASPVRGIEPTIALAERLQAAGFRAVPHLSARTIRDRAHLNDIVARLKDAGISRAFVVGGDAKEHGAFPDGVSLLRAIDGMGRPLSEIGIPGYPQGHPFIADGPLLHALHEKAAYANYMTTQLCFQPRATRSWIVARRAEGIALPVQIGVPGAMEAHRLLAISARIGVADPRFLTKNLRFVARLIRSGGSYRPDGLLEALAPHIADPATGITGIHLYTFNAVEAMERWRQRFLTGLTVEGAMPSAVDRMRGEGSRGVR